MNVYVLGVTTGGEDSEGIHAAANAGDIDIYAGAVTTGGEDSTGIHAWSGAGDIDINAVAVGTGGDDSEGIRAVADAGSIDIDAVAVVTAGNDSDGIHVEATGGDIDVDAAIVTTGGDDSHGIYADAYGGGNISLNAGVVGTTGDYSTGISAWANNQGNGGGNIGISAGSITTEGYNAFGVWAHTAEGTGAGGNITVDVGGIATTGDGADGIVAMTDDGGDIKVDADTVSTEGYSSKGIYASAWSDGDVAVTAGSVTTAGDYSDGIYAEAEDGDVTVTAGSVTTAGDYSDGIHAEAEDGDVAVDVDSATATGTGSRGIYAMSDAGSTTITVHVEAKGGTGSGAAGVEFGGATGAVLNNEGFITAQSGRAIVNDGRNSRVENDGVVLGFVDMGAGDDIFNNNAAGIFRMDGDSDFGADTGDVFNNHGLVTMLWPSSPRTMKIEGLETFNNLDDSLVDLANGTAGDILDLVISNVDSTGTFAIDANLTPDGSPADRLHIGGDLTGTTALSVNDLDSGPGAYDPDGHLFAVVKGSTDAGNVPGVPSNFSVNDGAGIDKGLFRYDAYLLPDTGSSSGDNEWYLASVLDREAYEFPVIAGAMQGLWHASTGVWLDRTSDLRLGYGEAQKPVKAGAWFRLFGGNERRDFSNTATAPGGMIGPDHTYDDRFHQDYRGIMVGFDYIAEGQAANGADNAWLFGVLVGRTTADLDFDNSTTRVDSRANSVGAYATYMQGGLFVDALLKADFGKLDYASTLGGSTTETASGDFRSVGLSVDAGYRYDTGANWFIEPKATLAYVRTRYDNLDVAGTDVAFDNGESLRGRVGARVGTRIVTESGAVVEPWLEASLWHEFRGDYRVTLLSGGPDAVASYDMGGTFGQISGGVSFLNTGTGWTGFAKGSVYLGDDKLRGASANLGMRYTW